MYFELMCGVKYKVFRRQTGVFRYLKERAVSSKSTKPKFPDLEIVINQDALAAFSTPESIARLKESIGELGIFSKISFKFLCMRNANIWSFSRREAVVLQNLLMILPKDMRCQNVAIALAANQIHEVGIQCLLAVLQDVRDIDEIDIGSSQLPPFDRAVVAEIFSKFSAIKFLNFSNCENLDHQYLRAISNHCPVLKSLNVSRCNLSDRANLPILLNLMRLESLNISQNYLAQQDQAEFLRLLSQNKTIRSLSMARCDIDEFVMLGVLEVIITQVSPLCAINFSGNRLSEAVAFSTRIALSRGYLKELRLSNCSIDEAQMSNILDGVSNSESLQVLDLSEFNFSSPESKEQLFEAISAAKNLTSLSLNNCQISENDLPKFLTTHLKTLNLGFGDFRFEPANLQILKRNLDLQSLNLTFSFNRNANKVEIYEAIMVCNMVRKNLQIDDFLNVSGLDVATEISPQRMDELKSEAAEIAQKIKEERRLKAGFAIAPEVFRALAGEDLRFFSATPS
jgi:Ran GTPase-activating protein (RanGAP) involved in mRNA processing and transport